mmetsp:Transcript_40314/g.88496  ORF Transcript_40314/g.88496 Transcript_40314/m.88496 type:complete len:348 (-) Transcript_40314:495-1538(-)
MNCPCDSALHARESEATWQAVGGEFARASAGSMRSCSGLEKLFELLRVGALCHFLDEALPAEVDLNLLHHVELCLRGDHIEGAARSSESACPANAVEVRLRIALAALLHRHVVLDDERHRRHVDSSRKHVGRDEEAREARAKVVEHLVSRRLLHSTVQLRDGVAAVEQTLADFLDRVARVGKDDALANSDDVEDVGEEVLLLLDAVGLVVHLAHLVVEDVVAFHLDLRPISIRDCRHLLRKFLDRVGPRRREEERLHILGQPLPNALGHVSQPAEKQHLVSLVEHEDLELRGVHHAHVDESPHLPRCANDDLLLHDRAALVPLLSQDGLHDDRSAVEQVFAHFEHLL